MKTGTHKYVYGKFYDSNNEILPSETSEYDLIVYAQPNIDILRRIGSLEGIFESFVPLIKKGEKVNGDWQPVVKRNQLKDFEKKYCGKFSPF